MALDSFYGGRQGVSPVIKGRFRYVSVDDPAYKEQLSKGLDDKQIEELKPYIMEECFADTNYKNVWYNELAIIDTLNKNNANNGKIFRRTLKNENNISEDGTLHGEYIGQIVGPSSTAPFIRIGSIQNTRDTAVKKSEDVRKTPGLEASYFYSTAPTEEDNDNNADGGAKEGPLYYLYEETKPGSKEYKRATDEYGPIVGAISDTTSGLYTELNEDLVYEIKGGLLDSNKKNGDAQLGQKLTGKSDTATVEMVPGKAEDGTYHDSIVYNWFDFRSTSSDGDADCWLYLGFQVPYPSLAISNETLPYRYKEASIEKDENETAEHPFSHKWTLYIPRGVRGNSVFEFTKKPRSDFRNTYEGSWGTKTDKPVLYESSLFNEYNDEGTENDSFDSWTQPPIPKDEEAAIKITPKDFLDKEGKNFKDQNSANDKDEIIVFKYAIFEADTTRTKNSESGEYEDSGHTEPYYYWVYVGPYNYDEPTIDVEDSQGNQLDNFARFSFITVNNTDTDNTTKLLQPWQARWGKK